MIEVGGSILLTAAPGQVILSFRKIQALHAFYISPSLLSDFCLDFLYLKYYLEIVWKNPSFHKLLFIIVLITARQCPKTVSPNQPNNNKTNKLAQKNELLGRPFKGSRVQQFLRRLTFKCGIFLFSKDYTW